jgi:hypothetical protein
LVEKGKGPWQKKNVIGINFSMIFVGGREDEDKRRQKKRSNFNLTFFSKLLFWNIHIKNSTHSFFGARSFLLFYIRFTPSERPQKSHLPWSDFTIHGVNRP